MARTPPPPKQRIRGFRVTGETRHVTEVSWELGSEVPLPKIEKYADLAHYFWEMAKFCVQKNKTSNVRGSISGLNRIFTGEIPQ